MCRFLAQIKAEMTAAKKATEEGGRAKGASSVPQSWALSNVELKHMYLDVKCTVNIQAHACGIGETAIIAVSVSASMPLC
jgi:hypothetical protein